MKTTFEFYTSKGRFNLTTSKDIDCIESFKVSDIDDIIASNIVDSTILYITHNVKKYKYKCYCDGHVGFDNALDSFNSLLTLYEIDNIDDYILYIMD